MNATNDITAIRARLPYFDRRALSQAWFSAFHLATDTQSPALERVLAAPEVASDAPPGRRPRGLSGNAAQVFAPAGPVLRRFDASGGERFAAAVRRRERGVVVRRLPKYAPPFRASFTLPLEGARVQILLRREGSALHVVALCTRSHVELVRRALLCAELALRAHGQTVRSSLRAQEART